MLIEIIFKGGTREKMITGENVTLLQVVENAEQRHSDKVKSIRIIKHDKNRKDT